MVVNETVAVATTVAASGAPSAAFQYMVLGLFGSILLNLFILGAVFVSGVGQRVLLRYKQRWLYKKGKYANCILIRNNNVARTEHFVKKEKDGSFMIEDKRYVVNPYATFTYDGIPTQINLEGVTEPIIPNEKDKLYGRMMSTAEIEKVIMNNNISDLALMLKKYFPLMIILIVLVALFAGLSIYFNWKIYDIIYQKDAIQALINAAENATTTGGITPR